MYVISVEFSQSWHALLMLPGCIRWVRLPFSCGTLFAYCCHAGKGSQQVSVIGSTAYVPQAPFILGGTVRDNIMFGREYDEARYRVAVQAAQLEPDLAQLPAGDMTELGE
jgi:hypothetical protein